MERIGPNPSIDQLRRSVLQMQNQLAFKGKFTLAENATTTVVPVFGFAPTSIVLWSATTVDAQAEPTMRFEASRGQFTVFHSSSASTTRTFAYTVVI